jgi:hypothetical protein
MLWKPAKRVKHTSAMLIEKIAMVVGGGPEVPSYLRDQMGQIFRSPQPARSAGTTTYRGISEEVGTTLYGLGTQGKAEFLGNRLVRFRKFRSF